MFNKKWQVRLQTHRNWQLGDQIKQCRRNLNENHWLSCLRVFLLTRPFFTANVNEFIFEYPTNQLNQQHLPLPFPFPFPVLPPRGNFIRLVCHREDQFLYNQVTGEISLRLHHF
jgi:hypothetical protein